jgi:hypothetical protein
MMKRMMTMRLLSLARPLPLLLCALLPPALIRCGAAVDDYGTETGNPPVIQKSKLRLEETPDGLRLIGEPRAVPSGASVRVTNLRSGASLETSAGADGSLDVALDGERSDDYELIVTTAGGEARTTLSAAALPDDLSTLSCDGLNVALENTVWSSFASVDRACTQDTDCVSEGWGNECFSRCTGVIASRAGSAAASLEASERIQPLCDQRARARCPALPEPSCAPLPPVLCQQGQCVAQAETQLSCEDSSREAYRRRDDVLRRASHECTVADECAIVTPRLSCVADCYFGAAIAMSAVLGIDPEIEAIEQQVCVSAAEQRGCEPPRPLPCEPPGDPRVDCVQGTCTLSFPPFE